LDEFNKSFNFLNQLMKDSNSFEERNQIQNQNNMEVNSNNNNTGQNTNRHYH